RAAFAPHRLNRALPAPRDADQPLRSAVVTGGAELAAGAAEAMMRAGTAYFDDRFADARTELAQAVRDFFQAGELRAAARAATMLGELHWDVLGNEPAGRGWLERARRLLERAGPCVEWGYWELARVACDRPDADDLQRSADRALEIAIEYGDVAL